MNDRNTLSVETDRMLSACEVLHPILDLLDGPRGENRTFIHDLLGAYRGSSPIVQAVSDLTEDVTNGDIAWAAYGERCRALIAGHPCGGRCGTGTAS